MAPKRIMTLAQREAEGKRPRVSDSDEDANIHVSEVEINKFIANLQTKVLTPQEKKLRYKKLKVWNKR